MAIQSTGTMANIESAISSQKHNIILPKEAGYMVGRTLIQQTKIQQTDAGSTQRKINQTVVASGIPLEMAKKAVEKTSAEVFAGKVIEKTQAILLSNGIIDKLSPVDLLDSKGIQKEIKEIDLLAKNHGLKPLSKASTQELTSLLKKYAGDKDVSQLIQRAINIRGYHIKDLASIQRLFSHIDELAINHNLGRLSTMSVSKLKELLEQYDKADDIKSLIKLSIALKGHQKNLSKLNFAQSRFKGTWLMIARSATKDLDSVNVAVTGIDAYRTTQRTVRTIKVLLKKLAARKATKTAAKTVTKAVVKKTSKAAASAVAKTATKKVATKAGAKIGTKIITTTVTKWKLIVVPKSPIGWLIAGIAFLILVFIMIIMLAVQGLANIIPGFHSASDGNNPLSVADSQAGIVYYELKEKDAVFIDEINNYKDNSPPQSETGEPLYGYWDPKTNTFYSFTEWSNANIIWQNGNGDRFGDENNLKKISNTKGIISAANIFIDMDFENNGELFKTYSHQLWEDSHNFETEVSDIYTCSEGCANHTYNCNDSNFYAHVNEMFVIGSEPVEYSAAGCVEHATDFCSGCKTITCSGYHDNSPCTGHLICRGHSCEQASYSHQEVKFYACSGCATSSEDETVKYCPYGDLHSISYNTPVCPRHCDGHDITYCVGHIDLTITATVNNVEDESNSLFDVDSTNAPFVAAGKSLWDKENKDLVIMLAKDDWYELYGIGEEESADFAYSSVSEEVEAYHSLIEKYAAESGISEYTELIKAVMMQESGGQGSDPMQASECDYNTQYPNEPNGITDSEYSIKVGIMYLADCLRLAKVESPSDVEHIKLALQGYNFGTGYITWALENYGGYSLENASKFSNEKAQENEWDAYGDKLYVSHVLRYYSTSKGNQSIVETALSQVGNHGGQPYWSWYGFDYRVAWCACFVSWCADQGGYIDDGTILKFAYCPTGAEWFKQQGLWKGRYYEPVAGDIIFFDWEGDGVTDHVGIVSKTLNGTVYTVEGNSSDQCKKKEYPVGSDCIYGYGTPSYSSNSQ